MNQKKINYIIATSAAEKTDLDGAIASVVAKSRLKTAFKEHKITALEGLMKDSYCHDPCPQETLMQERAFHRDLNLNSVQSPLLLGSY